MTAAGDRNFRVHPYHKGMRINSFAPTPQLRSTSTPQTQAPSEKSQPRDSFFSCAADTASLLGLARGARKGFELGAPLGRQLALMAGASGGALTAASMVGGAGLAMAGCLLMDWVGRAWGGVGAELDKQNPSRGETIGRTVMLAGMDLAYGRWESALLDTGVISAGGFIRSHLR